MQYYSGSQERNEKELQKTNAHYMKECKMLKLKAKAIIAKWNQEGQKGFLTYYIETFKAAWATDEVKEAALEIVYGASYD